MTLDALLMAKLQTGDVSHLIQCVEGLYYCSAAIFESTGIRQVAAFSASMRADRTYEWPDVIARGRPGKRTPGGDVTIGPGRKSTAGNVLNSYSAACTPFVEWHATGDGHAILDILKDIPAIGKRRTSGYGEVANWELGESDLDGLVGYANEPLRPIPVDRWTHGGDWIAVDAAWKAPYWEVRNRDKCYAPEVIS